MRVTVAWSPGPRQVVERAVDLPEGAPALEALRAVDVPMPDEGVPLGIWGRPATVRTPLREGDRLELWRPLRVDPKTARRERFRSQGSRAAGLFARKR